jgi:hypothetical protein
MQVGKNNLFKNLSLLNINHECDQELALPQHNNNLLKKQELTTLASRFIIKYAK